MGWRMFFDKKFHNREKKIKPNDAFFDQMQNRAMQTQSIGEQDLERVENKYHS